ncbi:Serine/threonine protein phosphatase [Lachnospiraceae bacterium TWA4]|nr:Serine/threonine protein phosphatase [Lachnospiraceae bacterium TWA4]
MSTYVVSDIHGELEQFKELLQKINFTDNDTLYVLGDVIDRGPHPIKTLQFLMTFPNIFPLAGNHELMCIENLQTLMNEITDEFLDSMNNDDYEKLSNWILNGGTPTLNEFAKLTSEEKEDIIDYLEDEFAAYAKLCVNNQNYLLLHAGIYNFSKNKRLDHYSIHDFVWHKPDYTKPYFKDCIVITGHTPTQTIKDNPKPGYIFRGNGHIAIDCGVHFDNGRIGALCLETGEEFYSRE